MILMKFKFLGTEIYVSFLFMAVVTVMLATDKTGMVLPSLFAVIMHETGHLFAMWVLDCAPKQIKLIPASVQITEDITNRYRTDIAVALCGPLTNLLLFGVFYFNYLSFKNDIVLCYALINIIIGIFNLLPVTGLDGGTVLLSVLAKNIDYNRARCILRIITLVTAAAILFVGVMFTLRGKLNISIYIFGLYLLVMSILKS